MVLLRCCVAAGVGLQELMVASGAGRSGCYKGRTEAPTSPLLCYSAC